MPKHARGASSIVGFGSRRVMARRGERGSNAPSAHPGHAGAPYRARGVALCRHVVVLVTVAMLVSSGVADTVTLMNLERRIVVDGDGRRVVQLSAVVVNHGESPLVCRVQFIVEQRDSGSGQGIVVVSKTASAAESQRWVAVKTISVAANLPAGATSAYVQAVIPYDELIPGKLYRFRAKVVDPETGLEPASADVMRLSDSAGRGAGLTALGILSSGLPADGRSRASGSGVMVGHHEAHRINGEWIENGSGTISMGVSDGHLHLQYTYSARGASTAELAAEATATGEMVGQDGSSVRVEISSASAQMAFPGVRREADGTISKSGARATGTFSGTIGGTQWSGVLTLRRGTYTLNPDTGRGEHRFEIQLVRAVSSTAVERADSLRQSEEER